MGMKSYIARRILLAIPQIFALMILVFALIQLAPGDPASTIAGDWATHEQLEYIRKEYGFDRPMHEQLLTYIGTILQGNLGRSIVRGQMVTDLILEKLPATLLLMGTSLLFSSILGIILGVFASKKPGSKRDTIIVVGSVAGFSIPVFWLGQILVLFFALYLKLFPSGGFSDPVYGFDRIASIARHLFLPALTLGLLQLALYTRMTRANMLTVLRSDFIVTAICKGLNQNTVFFKHGLRNALLPVVTIIGMRFGSMFTGAIMTETIFSWPGLGRAMYESIMGRDYTCVTGLFIFISSAIIFLNLITDVVYRYIDPRIQYR